MVVDCDFIQKSSVRHGAVAGRASTQEQIVCGFGCEDSHIGLHDDLPVAQESGDARAFVIGKRDVLPNVAEDDTALADEVMRCAAAIHEICKETPWLRDKIACLGDPKVCAPFGGCSPFTVPLDERTSARQIPGINPCFDCQSHSS